MKEYNKLVRDKIPYIILNERKWPYSVSTLGPENQNFRWYLLRKKLLEEAQEFHDLPNLDELADIYEVLDAIKREFDISDEEISKVMIQKAHDKGAFDNMIYLVGVDDG